MTRHPDAPRARESAPAGSSAAQRTPGQPLGYPPSLSYRPNHASSSSPPPLLLPPTARPERAARCRRPLGKLLPIGGDPAVGVPRGDCRALLTQARTRTYDIVSGEAVGPRPRCRLAACEDADASEEPLKRAAAATRTHGEVLNKTADAGLRSAARNNKATRLLTRPGRTS
jgi:hypothetical protein